MPQRCISVDSPDSETYTLPNNSAEVRLQNFQCNRTWFLFVPTGYTCQLTQSVVTNHLLNYVAKPCFSGGHAS